MSFDYIPSVGEVQTYFINTRGEIPERDWGAYSEAKNLYGLNDNWIGEKEYRQTIENIIEALDLND
jgi:hypothetical protein|tara:strand:- start:98 stop:295 length:198 start_codon:yes stop_codon:yes gene_type:complete